ncbi:hypothetical protein [Burkholderia stabilis]|uniref:hypothetical protein n=1 Tax=Burkholderia stabilis TaxID=95485 RepID=UPI0013E941AF|nr:hypothetical protein [Burkholderia stabilis]
MVMAGRVADIRVPDRACLGRKGFAPRSAQCEHILALRCFLIRSTLIASIHRHMELKLKMTTSRHPLFNQKSTAFLFTQKTIKSHTQTTQRPVRRAVVAFFHFQPAIAGR